MPYRVKSRYRYRKTKSKSKMPKTLQKKIVKKVVSKVMHKAETYRAQKYESGLTAYFDQTTYFTQTGKDLSTVLRTGTLTAWASSSAGALDEKIRGWEIFLTGLQIKAVLTGCVSIEGNPPFVSALTRIIIVMDKQPADVSTAGNPNLTLYDDSAIPAGGWNHCILQNKTFNSPIVKNGRKRFVLLHDRIYKTCNLRQNIVNINIFKKINKKFCFYPNNNNLNETIPVLDKRILMFAFSATDNPATTPPFINFISTMYYKDF